MKRYKVIVEGRNCLLPAEGTLRRMGFFGTRFVKAHDAAAAEKMAIETVQRELMEMIVNPAENPPNLSIDNIQEQGPLCRWWRAIKGFSWYREDEIG